MPKKALPIVLPYKQFCYDDDAGKPAEIDLSHLSEQFALAEALKSMGAQELAEYIRPVHRIAGFEAIRLIERLREMETDSGGRAGIVYFTSDRRPDILWNPGPNAVNQLNNIQLSGFVVGIVCLCPDNSFTTYVPPCEDLVFRSLVLNGVARSCQENPSWIAAADILRLDTKEAFEPANVETTLNAYSKLMDQTPPIDIHSEISTQTVRGTDARN